MYKDEPPQKKELVFTKLLFVTELNGLKEIDLQSKKIWAPINCRPRLVFASH